MDRIERACAKSTCIILRAKGHLRLGSFPLVPKDDNSLLLIN